MSNKIPMIVMITILASKVWGQEDTPLVKKYKSSVFVELSTVNKTFATTINYELFVSKKPGGLSFRVGAGATFSGDDVILTIPANISYSIGISPEDKHFIELGTGFTGYVFEGPEGFGNILGFWPIPIWNGIVGYRLMSNRLHVRATYMPRFIDFDPERQSIGGIFGVSFGIRF